MIKISLILKPKNLEILAKEFAAIKMNKLVQEQLKNMKIDEG